MAHMDKYFEPVPCGDDCRVYVEIKGKELRIHVGGAMVRMYSLTELPDHLRSQLAMVFTQNWDSTLWFPWDSIETYPTWYPPQYEHIGWRLSHYKYVLVLPRKVLEELRGEVSRG